MSCAQVQALVPMAALDVLDDDERDLLDAHTIDCARCRARQRAFETAIAPLADPLPDPAPAPATWDRVLARIAEAPAVQGKDVPPLDDELEEEEELVDDDAAPTIALACVFCHGALTRDRAVYCASCLAPQHDDCFAAHGACAAPGCGEQLVVRPRGERERRPPRRRLGWVVTTGLSAVLGSAAALTAWDARAPRVERAPPPAAPAAPACSECDRPGDPTLPPLRLEDEPEPVFCEAAHRTQYLVRRALARRGWPLEARLVTVGHGPAGARIDAGLLGGVAPGDQFALWRAGSVIGRLTIDGADDDVAWGSTDLVAHGRAPRPGDVAVRVDERGFWSRVAAQQEAERRVAEIAARAERPRVLYVEGAPRWEYQHLRRVLTRWTRAQVWLLSADAGFVQDASPGLTPLEAAPTSLDGYDVVILGAGVWRPASALDLKGFVRRGGGLVLMPGSAGPSDVPDEARDLSPVDRAYASSLGPSDEELRSYRFGPALARARDMFGGRALPALQGGQPGRVREGATVQLADAKGQPVIVTWSVGPGRVVYVGADDLWRWRRSAGEEPHAALWLEVISWAVGRGGG